MEPAWPWPDSWSFWWPRAAVARWEGVESIEVVSSLGWFSWPHWGSLATVSFLILSNMESLLLLLRVKCIWTKTHSISAFCSVRSSDLGQLRYENMWQTSESGTHVVHRALGAGVGPLCHHGRIHCSEAWGSGRSQGGSAQLLGVLCGTRTGQGGRQRILPQWWLLPPGSGLLRTPVFLFFFVLLLSLLRHSFIGLC